MSEGGARERFFDQAAPQWHEAQQMDGGDAARARFVGAATANAPASILDVGCGTGILVPHILRCCPRARVVELDSSAAMIAENRLRHGDAVETVCAGLQEWQSSRLFEALLCFNALPHLGPPNAALDRMASLLRLGGRLAVGHSMCSRQLNAMHARKRQVADDVALRARQIANMLPAYMETVAVEESPGWYLVLSQKMRQP